MGALSDYVGRRFGVKTRAVVNPLVITGVIPAGITQILRNNPDRLMLLIMNLDTAKMMAAPHANPATNIGVWLDANGGHIALDADTDGELVGQEWWVWSAAGAAVPNIYIIETEAE